MMMAQQKMKAMGGDEFSGLRRKNQAPDNRDMAMPIDGQAPYGAQQAFDMNYMQIQQQMKIDAGLGAKPKLGISSEAIHKIQKYKTFLENPQKSLDEQAVYNLQMIKALGADTMEEAMTIIKTAGI